MSNQFVKLLFCILIFSQGVCAQGNLCATNVDQTQKILKHLENRLLCETLSESDCIKLIAGGTAAGVGGLVAAKKLLKLGQLGLNPNTDIICGAKREAFSIYERVVPSFNIHLLLHLVSRAEASSPYFCQLHPGASYRSEVENLTKAMSQEIDRDIQGLKNLNELNGDVSSARASETDKAKKQLADAAEDYLARLKLVDSDEARRIYPVVERQIREASANSDYRSIRAHMRSSFQHLESRGLNVKAISPDLETFRKNIEVVNKKVPVPSVSCNLTKEIQALVDINSTNEIFVKSEFQKMKTKCPSLQVDELTKKMLSVSRKKVALSLAIREKATLESDMRKLSQKHGGHVKNLASSMNDLSRQSVMKLNKIPLTQFNSPDIGLTAGSLEKWGRGLGLLAPNLHSFARTARALSPVALLAGGKAAIASTGVGAIPIIAETALEEAVLQSVTFKPEECIAQEMQSPRNRNASLETQLGYHFLDFKLSNCEPNLELGSKLAGFLQLSPNDRLNILGQNDKLCSAIHHLYNKENKLINFEATCVDDKGGFKLHDLQAEEGNYKLIQQRSREARDARLTGDDYEKYVRGNLVSRDQIVRRNQNSFQVTYTSTVSQLAKCSKFEINLNSEQQNFTNSCSPLTRPVLDSMYDYALLSAQCSGVSQAFSEIYGKNFKRDGLQRISSGSNDQR